MAAAAEATALSRSTVHLVPSAKAAAASRGAAGQRPFACLGFGLTSSRTQWRTEKASAARTARGGALQTRAATKPPPAAKKAKGKAKAEAEDVARTVVMRVDDPLAGRDYRPAMDGDEPDFWEGEKWDWLGFVLQYLWVFGIVIAGVASIYAVTTYQTQPIDDGSSTSDLLVEGSSSVVSPSQQPVPAEGFEAPSLADDFDDAPPL